jgi:Zinc finger C-x8-C-x5-C-x3-H type (and similar)
MQEEKECAYYLRTGQCKFGGTCKFHHPQPSSNAMISLRGGTSSSIYSPQAVTSPVYAARASFITSPRWQGPSSYAQVILPQGLVQVPGWNPYPVSLFHLVLFHRFSCTLFSYRCFVQLLHSLSEDTMECELSIFQM